MGDGNSVVGSDLFKFEVFKFNNGGLVVEKCVVMVVESEKRRRMC